MFLSLQSFTHVKPFMKSTNERNDLTVRSAGQIWTYTWLTSATWSNSQLSPDTKSTSSVDGPTSGILGLPLQKLAGISNVNSFFLTFAVWRHQKHHHHQELRNVHFSRTPLVNQKFNVFILCFYCPTTVASYLFFNVTLSYIKKLCCFINIVFSQSIKCDFMFLKFNLFNLWTLQYFCWIFSILSLIAVALIIILLVKPARCQTSTTAAVAHLLPSNPSQTSFSVQIRSLEPLFWGQAIKNLCGLDR